MTGLLLDTHALLFAINGPHRLGDRARTELLDRSTPLFVSPVSAWELSTEHRIGKLPEATGMLAAQAITENLRLVTRDHAFASLPVVRTLWEQRTAAPEHPAACATIPA